MLRAALRITTIACATGVFAAGACGGMVVGYDIPGGLDDAGVFHQPDGAILFAPGSGCTGFDAAIFEAPPSCQIQVRSSEVDPIPDENSRCAVWGAGALTIHYPVDTYCVPCDLGDKCAADAGKCIAVLGAPKTPALRCNPGAAGDAYCAAFFQQYVRGNGVAAGRCERLCYQNNNCQCFKTSPDSSGTHKYGDWDSNPRCPDEDFMGTCVPDGPGPHFCSEHVTFGVKLPDGLCVSRDGKEATPEPFCADPP